MQYRRDRVAMKNTENWIRDPTATLLRPYHVYGGSSHDPTTSMASLLRCQGGCNLSEPNILFVFVVLRAIFRSRNAKNAVGSPVIAMGTPCNLNRNSIETQGRGKVLVRTPWERCVNAQIAKHRTPV